MSSVGHIGLESLMDRANIAFLSGYRFKGRINQDILERSYYTIFNQSTKYKHKIEVRSQSSYAWKQANEYASTFLRFSGDDIDQVFAEVSRNSYQYIDASNGCPSLFIVITPSPESSNDEFIIGTLNEHTWCDARSSDYVFNKIIEHYNAQCVGDESLMKVIEEQVATLETVPGEVLIEERFANAEACHDSNTEKLMSYEIEDAGRHGIPIVELNEMLLNYDHSSFTPVIKYYDTNALVDKCRKSYPKVTRNSVICAAIVKAFHAINVQDRGVDEEHIVSFKMLSDLLPSDMRKKYTGNYIAFVPVSVEGKQSIEDVANDINNRIVEFKTSLEDVSMFSILEDLVKQEALGEGDELLSFIVTNWNNYTFTHSKNYLKDCVSLRHQSSVNVRPKDVLGASLINRPVVVISFSPDNTLCLSLFSSLRSNEESKRIAIEVEKIITP